MKKSLMMVLIFMLLASGAATSHAAVRVPASYVAIGDSLAAGQTPNSEIDAGYADMIAQELARQQPVAFYTKDLAFPGFTTQDVLDRITSEEAQDVLKNANIITVSAGANDLLRLVSADPAEGSLSFGQIQVDFALNGARANLEKILAELEQRAPEADVYVMGYYFAYPHARESQKAGTALQLDRLNEILETTAQKNGAEFVPVADGFGDDAVGQVPNAADVHPNLNGYQTMANAFFDVYQKGWTVEDWEVPDAAPVSFEEIQAQQDEESSGEMEGSSAAVNPSRQNAAGLLALKEAIPYS
ncbi:GDSL-type esterase/lipase family protein [Planococcus sp. APC 3906]|uniref:SGNH/GDSL hydrolase family protein n=1 Tax=Planococcus sp. APC 3906 TaxID=3035194 RepID=UPI0033B50618